MDAAAPRPSTADDSGHGGVQILIGAGPARFVADVTQAQGGLDLGPDPHDLVAAGLAACTSMTLRLYARQKGWPLGAVHVEVTHHRDPSATPAETFSRANRLSGPLDEAQTLRLMEIAERCPIHRLLTAGASVVTTALA